jgi:aminoglycoside phosphotransferase (APT) family kinase protein
VHLARRIADALHKLQSSGVASTRVHALQDELDILHQRLASVAESRPDWAPRIGAILDVCDRLGSAIPDGEPRRVHRDFYQDQVIVGEDGRLYLLDLDLYAEGDPAVDAGNFLAHLTEWGLRALGDPDAMADRQAAFERRFVERTGGRTGPAVQAYAFLSLVRHVSISVQIPERRPFTEQILRLCERRQPDVRVLSAQPALAL